jgi:DNA-binding MarR family transcriptional regulator
MQTRTTPPLARNEALVVEELGDELLVYDLSRDEAHSLGTVAAQVWKACDGKTTIDELATRLGLDRDAVVEAVEGLSTCYLLEDERGRADVTKLTRRGLSLKAAKLGAAAAAAPLIVSIAAPTAAMAVTEAFCQGISVSANGCGDCHKFGCCCCEPPGGTTKPCHADCITHPDCNIDTQPNCNGSTDNCKLHGG